MARCLVCDRGKTVGNNVSHANNRTKRTMMPNLQRAKVVYEGKTIRANVCTRCMRSGLVKKAV